MQQLPRNSDLHSRASRHGKYNLVCPCYKSKTEGGDTFQVYVGLSSGMGFLWMCTRGH